MLVAFDIIFFKINKLMSFMVYLCGGCYQQSFYPPSYEEYVSEKGPVRVYDMFINSLDSAELGIVLESRKNGRTPFIP